MVIVKVKKPEPMEFSVKPGKDGTASHLLWNRIYMPQCKWDRNGVGAYSRSTHNISPEDSMEFTRPVRREIGMWAELVDGNKGKLDIR